MFRDFNEKFNVLLPNTENTFLCSVYFKSQKEPPPPPKKKKKKKKMWGCDCRSDMVLVTKSSDWIEWFLIRV